MTSVNELNAITRTRKELQNQLHSRFGALLIAVYKLPLEQRIEVMEQYEKNYQTMLIEKAMERSGRDFGNLGETLVGNTALMFCHDMKEPAKAIKSFRKKTEIPYLKGAAIDADIFIGDNQLETLMALKTKNELIGEIIGMLQSPAQNVISALQASGGGKIAGLVKTLSERPE